MHPRKLLQGLLIVLLLAGCGQRGPLYLPGEEPEPEPPTEQEADEDDDEDNGPDG